MNNFFLQPGISLIFINLSKDSSFNVTLSDVAKNNSEFRGSQNREEYHLTPLDEFKQSDEKIKSGTILVNDVPMVLENSKDIPAMDPKLANASTPISVAAHSIVYVTIKDFPAPVCV